MHVQNLIVGCGFSGATLAHKIATELHEEVLIIDAKPHIAGHCYDDWQDGICVHRYGTHIFHTNLKHVWDFVGRFTQWYPYMHTVKAQIDGQEVPIPFNLNTIHQLFPSTMATLLTEKLISRFGFNVKVPILQLRAAEDKDLAFLADYIYEKVFLNYTLKQWGMKPEELDPVVTGRVPVYVSRDNRYFQDTYQGIPLNGYTAIVEKMLDHPLIKVQLNTSYQDVKNNISCDRLCYTGPIDEFFDYTLGALPYRSLAFDFVRFNRPYFQSGAVINYPNNYNWTRIGEYKYFLNTPSETTIVSYEYPQPFVQGQNDRYYPIVKTENTALYAQYAECATQLKNTFFLGRLGDYQYYDMDKAVARALDVFERIKNETSND